MEIGNGTLADAGRRLEALEADRARLHTELAKAVEDADADSIIRTSRALEENNVRQFAERARILRLRRDDEERDRTAAVAEREKLEAELKTATQAYAEAIEQADNFRIAMQEIQVRLFSIDSRIDSQRESINETSRQLRDHVSARLGLRWHGDNTKAASDDAACM